MHQNKSIIKKDILQFIIYGLIGGSNVFIDFLVINIFSHITNIYSAVDTHSKMMLLFFEAIAFVLYSLNGYFLNKKFTFKAQKSSYIKYALVLGISSFFNANLFVFLTGNNIFSLNVKLWFNISKLIASISIGILTFLVNKFFVFKLNPISKRS